MRRALTLSLDALAGLREIAERGEPDLAAAATVAELAGVDSLRVGLAEALRPVGEPDVRDLRRAAPRLELRMAPVPALLKVALDARPDRVLLASEGRGERAAAVPLDRRAWGSALAPAVRSLREEAGARVALLVAPDVEAVKAAHAADADGVELSTAPWVDLPGAEGRAELERLADAARLAAKLRLEVAAGGGLGPREIPPLLEAAPVVERVCVGRAAHARALLVGLERTVRDLRDRLA